jgi:prepilin peptidase CpaA
MVLETAMLLGAVGVFAAAAYCDLRARHIPNELSLAIGVLALVRLIPTGDPYPALWNLVAAAVVFVAAFVQWRFGLLGGGDAKLLTAAALMVGWRDLFDFLMLMSIAGAVVALAVVAARRHGGPSALLLPHPSAVETPARPSVPYGLAIAAAATWVLIRQYSLAK